MSLPLMYASDDPRTRRYPAWRRAEVEIDGVAVAGHVMEIGLRSARLVLDKGVPEDAEVGLEVELEDGSRVFAEAVVSRSAARVVELQLRRMPLPCYSDFEALLLDLAGRMSPLADALRRDPPRVRPRPEWTLDETLGREAFEVQLGG